MTVEKVTNVLFLCTGNSARSILSECLLNDLSEGRFTAYSAGSKPSGIPHPDGLKELARRGHSAESYSSKSWNVFAEDGAPLMDIIVTVCGNAAGETCPVWPRSNEHPQITVHWPADDPAHVEPMKARQKAFSDVYDICRARIEALVNLPAAQLTDRDILQTISKISA